MLLLRVRRTPHTAEKTTSMRWVRIWSGMTLRILMTIGSALRETRRTLDDRTQLERMRMLLVEARMESASPNKKEITFGAWQVGADCWIKRQYRGWRC